MEANRSYSGIATSGYTQAAEAKREEGLADKLRRVLAVLTHMNESVERLENIDTKLGGGGSVASGKPGENEPQPSHLIFLATAIDNMLSQRSASLPDVISRIEAKL